MRPTWISEPGAYRAQCSSAGGANVLQITALDGAQTATPSPDPTWGLHLLDANIELGNLVSVVHTRGRRLRGAPRRAAGPDASHVTPGAPMDGCMHRCGHRGVRYSLVP